MNTQIGTRENIRSCQYPTQILAIVPTPSVGQVRTTEVAAAS